MNKRAIFVAVLVFVTRIALADFEDIRALIDAGRFAEAEILARETISASETAFGPNALETARSLDIFVEIRIRAGMGSHSETYDAARRAASIKEAIPGTDPAEVSESLHNLAVVLHAHGHASAGNRHYRGMVEKREKLYGESSPDFIATLTVLAVSQMELGDPEGAEPLFARALALAEEHLDGNDPRTARILAGSAWVAAAKGNNDEALQNFGRAATILRAAFKEDAPRLATALADLGDLMVRAGAIEEARPRYEEALAHWGSSGELFAGRCTARLARIALESGDPASARDASDRALALLDHHLDVDAVELASLLSFRGRIHEELGDTETAEASYERAQSLYVSSGKATSAESSETLCRLARIRARAGDHEGAVGLALQAEAMDRESIRATALALPERQALSAAAARGEGLSLALSLAAGGLSGEGNRRVLDALIRVRALVLDELAIRNRVVSETTSPAVARLYDDFAAANAAHAKLVVRGASKDAEAAIEASLRERERAEAALAERSLVFRRDRAQSRAGFAEVNAALPADAALVSYVRSTLIDSDEPVYLAFVTRAGIPNPDVILLGDAENLEACVVDWGREIQSGVVAKDPDEAGYRRAGEALRAAVWDPLLPSLSGASRVFLVPDGALHPVSFAALPSGDETYLVETGPTFHILSAERDLATGESTIASQGLLAIGGADFDEAALHAEAVPAGFAPRPFRGKRPSCEGLDAVRFEPLPGTRAEIDAILAMWGPKEAIRLVGAQADEAAFKREAPGKSILHVATHGFFLDGRCTPAPASKVRGIGKLGDVSSSENPLLLSGLALAGANHRQDAEPDEEDGILTAEEIAALDLTGVRWAVLSGCDTGLGDVQDGEGVFGLRRAFQMAGVETLIQSLWPVEDEAARRWMQALYESRLSGMDTSRAVREASLLVLRARRDRGENTHPFFWGAFVAVGGYR